MTRSEVWVHTDTKIIRADTIRAVGGWRSAPRPVAGLSTWSPHDEPVHLKIETSGDKQPLTIRVQPDLPYIYMEDDETGKTADQLNDEVLEAAWERVNGLDEGLLRAIAAAAKILGGGAVFLDHDDQGFPKQWEIEPLASSAPRT
jgi:hypothetical protein